MKNKKNKLDNLTFWAIRKMLNKHNDWEYDEDDDDIIVHTSGLSFFADYNGICYRINNKTIYRPNIFAWYVLHIPVNRLKSYLSKVKKSND